MAETVLAFDIGGTSLKLAEVDRSGRLLWEERIAPAGEYTHDMGLLRGMADKRSSDVVAAAFACPGPLNFRTGQVLRAANLNWLNVYPGKDLSQILDMPVVVENDADCAALAEVAFGSGAGASLLVYYGVGTGVGSGLVDRGRIFHGAFDPEFGHQIMEPHLDRYCTAGHRGCLESLVSGGAMKQVFGSIEAVPESQWQEVIPHYLGQALANATLFLSPDMVILGGGVIDHRPDIVPPAIREMEVMLHGFVKPPRVMTSDLGREVGILGAAAAAWQLKDAMV